MPLTSLDASKHGDLLIFAGAGLSAGPPSSLPGWYSLNEMILSALRARLETGLERNDWLAEVISQVGTLRKAGGFPPDYQAQILEEIAGERYFRALQSLDVDVVNPGHEGIATLAASGAVRAIVTTNFDRLIEHALDRRGVPFDSVFDDAGFLRMADRLTNGAAGPLPVIKIHGSVSDHLSMIDTLKQRKLGRSCALQSCLDHLFQCHWLYLGFSADDIEAEPSYLGLQSHAPNSGGAKFVLYPGHPELSKGAGILKTAYGSLWSEEIIQIDQELSNLAAALGATPIAPAEAITARGSAKVEENLARWTSTLSLAASGLCLAAILESAGQAEAAARVLDKLVRNEIFEERGTPDFQLLQLNYGRLGAGLGRFSNVVDLNGVASNASVETIQSLLRLKGSEHQFPAECWLGCFWLWRNEGANATQVAWWIARGFTEAWEGLAPKTAEQAIDAWLSMAMILIVDTHPEGISIVAGTFPHVLEIARASGDVVRTARAISLYLLALAETSKPVPEISRSFDAEFAETFRVGDAFSYAFRELGVGRWMVGVGGLAFAKSLRESGRDASIVPAAAAKHLDRADKIFWEQGMDPWSSYSKIQLAKALIDLNRFDEAQSLVEKVDRELERFPIFASHFHEMVGQIQRALGKPEAANQFEAAIQSAEVSGLRDRQKWLSQR